MVIPGERDSATLAPSDATPPPRATSNAANVVSAAGPVTIAIPDSVDPAHAPWPRSEGEHLVFAQLYEPLVRIDCTGRIVPGLASSWSSDSSHTMWTFVLRDGARFRSGKAVTAEDVIASWRESAAAHTGSSSGAMIAAVAAGARALDSSTLAATIPQASASPRIFAAAELAVAQRPEGDQWPDGTTPYNVDSTAALRSPSAGARAVALRSSRTDAPSLLFRVAGPRDERDILDAGVDLLPTESPATTQYAATQPGRTVIPLPWSRTYALALPSRANAYRAAAAIARPDCDPRDTRGFRDALAAAVHADARGAEGPFWWAGDGGTPGAQPAAAASPCDTTTPTAVAGDAAHSVAPAGRERVAARRIAYQRGDATARELAERIVALAAPGRESDSTAGLASVAPEMTGAGSWRAVALDSLDFARALAAGTEPAYVITLTRRPVAPVLAAAAALADAPWLGTPERPGSAIVPLIDTRSLLIALRGSAPLHLVVDWDGTLIFGAPPPPPPPPPDTVGRSR
jgi:hypothetical protein